MEKPKRSWFNKERQSQAGRSEKGEKRPEVKNLGHFKIVPQTEEQIEKNRKMIEELRAKGLLEQHEKTFRIKDDGTVEQLD